MDDIEQRIAEIEQRPIGMLPFVIIDDIQWLISQLREARKDTALLDTMQSALAKNRHRFILGAWWSRPDTPDGFSASAGDPEDGLDPTEHPTLREAITALTDQTHGRNGNATGDAGPMNTEPRNQREVEVARDAYRIGRIDEQATSYGAGTEPTAFMRARSRYPDIPASEPAVSPGTVTEREARIREGKAFVDGAVWQRTLKQLPVFRSDEDEAALRYPLPMRRVLREEKDANGIRWRFDGGIEWQAVAGGRWRTGMPNDSTIPGEMIDMWASLKANPYRDEPDSP